MSLSRTAPMVLEELPALRDKYAQMRAMRLAHAAGDEQPHEVRKAMADLALRFPGALREIDELELTEIEWRIERLGAALSGAIDVEPWMEAMALFHRLARGALCAKRWLSGRRVVTPEVATSFRADAAELAFPNEALDWESHLGAVAAPPAGRVTQLVYERMAVRLAITAEEARSLVFPERRRP